MKQQQLFPNRAVPADAGPYERIAIEAGSHACSIAHGRALDQQRAAYEARLVERRKRWIAELEQALQSETDPFERESICKKLEELSQ